MLCAQAKQYKDQDPFFRKKPKAASVSGWWGWLDGNFLKVLTLFSYKALFWERYSGPRVDPKVWSNSSCGALNGRVCLFAPTSNVLFFTFTTVCFLGGWQGKWVGIGMGVWLQICPQHLYCNWQSGGPMRILPITPLWVDSALFGAGGVCLSPLKRDLIQSSMLLQGSPGANWSWHTFVQPYIQSPI